MWAWIALVVAGLLEIVWASTMKLTDGFTRLWPSVVTILVMVASFALLSQAMRSLPVGTSYAVWVGIGAVGTALVGMLVYHEPATPLRLLFLAMIAGGIIGLRAVS
jgi:quaternary ammonium compound-resistance protein SugE